VEPNRINREDFRSLVEAGIQAPSADDLHPWTFDASGNVVRVWVTMSSRKRPRGVFTGRMQKGARRPPTPRPAGA
jgi:hypothetical protein